MLDVVVVVVADDMDTPVEEQEGGDTNLVGPATPRSLVGDASPGE